MVFSAAPSFTDSEIDNAIKLIEGARRSMESGYHATGSIDIEDAAVALTAAKNKIVRFLMSESPEDHKRRVSPGIIVPKEDKRLQSISKDLIDKMPENEVIDFLARPDFEKVLTSETLELLNNKLKEFDRLRAVQPIS
ncbi:hypothetical protein LCGC14_2352070, partial [marine sediment metagenome]